MFLEYASKTWCDDFGPDLAEADDRPVLVSAGGAGWPLGGWLLVGGLGVAGAATATMAGQGLVRRSHRRSQPPAG